MKKKIVPSRLAGFFALIVLIIFPIVFLYLCYDVKMFSSMAEISLESFYSTGAIYKFLAIDILFVILLAFIVVFVMLAGIVLGVKLIYYSSRPLRFYSDEICVGIFKKKNYRKCDISGIGIAPAFLGPKYNKMTQNNIYIRNQDKKLGIYIAFGNFRAKDFSDYGILPVWQMIELHKIFPKAVEFDNRIDKKLLQVDALGSIQKFSSLLWISYTEDNMSFLRQWLGTRYDEVTQRVLDQIQ